MAPRGYDGTAAALIRSAEISTAKAWQSGAVSSEGEEMCCCERQSKGFEARGLDQHSNGIASRSSVQQSKGMAERRHAHHCKGSD